METITDREIDQLNLSPKGKAEMKFESAFNWDGIEAAKQRILSRPNRKKFPLNAAGKEQIPLAVIGQELMNKKR